MCLHVIAAEVQICTGTDEREGEREREREHTTSRPSFNFLSLREALDVRSPSERGAANAKMQS
jgi:hypothetical protein